MPKLCAYIFLFVSLQCCISCKKEYSNEQPFIDTDLTLVKTVKALHYDTSGAFYTAEIQTFSYDKSLNRCTAAITDSGKNVPGGLQQWTETFQYDDQNRLAQFISTSAYQAAAQINFMYGASGDIVKAVIRNQWLGNTVECLFNSSSINGQKLITMYDTSGNYYSNADTRPQVTKYTFDAAGRLMRETVYYTVFKRPQNWLEDTTDIKMFYDGNNYMSRQVTNYAYRFSQVSSVTDYARDSTVFTREGSNPAIQNTFEYIYKNMSWFSISENPAGFANALNLGEASYLGTPLKTAEYWKSYPPNPATLDHALGTYQNVFDAKGLLSNAVYPKRFANQYGGTTEIWYTYTNVKK
ncbi:MAG: hypothetical protein ABIQ88_10755 [Chitinophagaceae bacterium]